ncbi:hypothetical protein GJAV_G00059530 [Gymnothorax javanicus]|nr:hypothetical protein GJAV_G00059530 [Gymnothorax javanicus]
MVDLEGDSSMNSKNRLETVADILVGCLAIPFAITISIGLQSDFYGCLFLACFVLVLTQSSIFSLLAVAVDRYLAVRIPLRYNKVMTGRRAREIITLLWVLSFIIGLIPFLGWNMKDLECQRPRNKSSPGDGSVLSCQLRCYFESVVDMRYMVYCNFFGCVLPPLLLMLGLYAQIFSAVRQQLRQMEQKHREAGGSHSLLQQELHAVKSLAIIVGLFAICWLPVHILNCLTLLNGRLHNPPSVMYVAIILSHANSAVNPAIYAYRIQDFRKTFRRILARHFLCQRDELYAGSNERRRSRDRSSITAASEAFH